MRQWPGSPAVTKPARIPHRGFVVASFAGVVSGLIWWLLSGKWSAALAAAMGTAIAMLLFYRKRRLR
jgi:membrane associated rhomboid family serine protease